MSIAAELERLAELNRTGVLSDSEYLAAKTSVLNGATADVGRIHGLQPNTYCMLMHLSALLTYSGLGVILPIVMYLVGKDESDKARRHGAATVNWLISSLIYACVSALLCFALVGIPLLIVLGILVVVFPIIAAVKANAGKFWHYPLAIQFFDEN